jgi:malonate decarboxylase alpha subunit
MGSNDERGSHLLNTSQQTEARDPNFPKIWDTRRRDKAQRITRIATLVKGKEFHSSAVNDVLRLLLEPHDCIVLEGNNQKQANFLSASLAALDPKIIYDLHLLISSITRPEHLQLFERGIARRVDFAFAGAQSLRVAQLLEDGLLEIGAIHTYVELYARMFIDLPPRVAFICADKADRQGNLFTGPNTEDTPTIVEATAFRDGIVVAQVNEIVDELPRVDIPGCWVDLIVEAPEPYAIEPLFTRDPRQINEINILMGMMVIRGIYERYGITSLNHGIGLDTAAIELLLPTYGASLGLKGKICRNWALNPHPTLIPAIESGWVESVHCFGSEVGMEDYVAARPDIFFTGSDGSLRSNRVLCQLAGQYGVDLFIGSTLQMDASANSSTVVRGRISGFGGAPNMGHDPHGRRHPSGPWLKLLHGEAPIQRGRKLVVQVAETFQRGGVPVFVNTLDAVEVGKQSGMPIAPIMIYGDDVTHVVTEEGIAYLYRAEGEVDRRAALAAVAGVSPVGMTSKTNEVERLRRLGIIAYPEDLGVSRLQATRSLLAATSISDLVRWSGGLYKPPTKFRS